MTYFMMLWGCHNKIKCIFRLESQATFVKASTSCAISIGEASSREVIGLKVEVETLKTTLQQKKLSIKS